MLDEPKAEQPTPTATSHKVARNAVWLLAGQIASILLGVALTAELARGLGVIEFGNYYILVSIAALAFVAVEWGQSALLVREAAKRKHESGLLLGGALVFRGAVGILAIIASVTLAALFGFDERIQQLTGLMIVCGMPLILAQAYVYVFRSRDRMDLESAVNVSAKAITVAATFVALLSGGDLTAVVTVQAIGGLCALFLAAVLSTRIGVNASLPDKEVLREFAVSGGPIAAFFLALAVQPFLDAVILSKLAPPEAVGWYGAARNVMNLLFVPAQILGTASFPEMSRVAQSVPLLRETLRHALKQLLVLGTLGCVGTYLFADFAVDLIYGGRHFEPAGSILKACAFVLPVLFVDILFGTTLTAIGKTKEIAAVKIASIGVAAFLSFVFIPYCQSSYGNGGIGLVVALGCAELMMTSAFLYLLPKGILSRGSLVDLTRALVCGAGTIVIFSTIPPFTPWLGIPLCIAAFAGLAYTCGLLSREDMKHLRSVLNRAP